MERMKCVARGERETIMKRGRDDNGGGECSLGKSTF